MNIKHEHALIWTVIVSKVNCETVSALKKVIVWYTIYICISFKCFIPAWNNWEVINVSAAFFF